MQLEESPRKAANLRLRRGGNDGPNQGHRGKRALRRDCDRPGIVRHEDGKNQRRQPTPASISASRGGSAAGVRR